MPRQSIAKSTLAGLALLVSTAFSANAASFTVNDIKGTPSEKLQLSVPVLQATDTNASEDMFRSLFNDGVLNIADDLANLNASEIHIPELHLTVPSKKAEGTASTIIYHNLVLNDVNNGVAKSATIESITADLQDSDTMTMGKTIITDLNIAAMLGFYGLTKAGPDFKTIYSDFTFQGGEIGGEKFKCSVGAMHGSDLSARPLKVDFATFLTEMTLLEDRTEVTPKQSGIALKYYADMLTAIKSGPLTFEGFDCAGLDKEDRDMTFSFGPLEISGFEPGWLPQMAMNDLKVNVENDGWLTLKNVTSKATDLSSLIAFLKSAPELVTKDWADANARSIVPAYAGFSISDLSFDIPNKDEPDTRIIADLAGFSLDLDNYVNGIPLTIAANIDKFHMPIAADNKDMAPLVAVGMTEITGSLALAAHRDAEAQSIVIDTFSISGKDLGSAAIKGTIGNVTDDLYSDDPDAALLAAMIMTVKDIQLDIIDNGMGDIAAKFAALENQQDPATLRIMGSAMAGAIVEATLKEKANAKAIGTAISALLSGAATNLTLTAKAINPAGIGMLEFAAAKDNPTLLINKVEINAAN